MENKVTLKKSAEKEEDYQGDIVVAITDAADTAGDTNAVGVTVKVRKDYQEKMSVSESDIKVIVEKVAEAFGEILSRRKTREDMDKKGIILS